MTLYELLAISPKELVLAFTSLLALTYGILAMLYMASDKYISGLLLLVGFIIALDVFLIIGA